MLKRLIPLALCGPLIALAALVVAPVSEASAACQIGTYLTEGRRGSDQVRCLQQTLNDAGMNSGPVDGWFGPVTRGAVVRYQQANGLTVDGQVGRQTGNSLGIWGGSRESAPAPAQRAERGTTTSSSGGGGGGGTVWDRLAQCESGGNWGISTGNGYYGGLQFLQSTWTANGGSGNPANASREEQIRVAENLRAKAGFSPWPACSRKLGLR